MRDAEGWVQPSPGGFRTRNRTCWFWISTNPHSVDEMTSMIPLENGRIHIAELPVLLGSPMAGHRLWELNLPKEIIVGCILRGDQSLIPRGDTTIAEGDVLLVITSDKTRLEKLKGLTPYASR